VRREGRRSGGKEGSSWEAKLFNGAGKEERSRAFEGIDFGVLLLLFHERSPVLVREGLILPPLQPCIPTLSH